MWMRGSLFAAAALAAVVLTSNADAQAWPPVGSKVSVVGCVGRSLDNLCQIIRDLKTGQPYTIQSAIPPIPPIAQKYVIHATGTVASWITFCWSGPILSNVHWYYVMRGPRCPRPAAKP
jgi:hypothetical protein